MTSKLPMVAGARPYFPEEDLPSVLDEIADVLRGGRLILGPRTQRLEAAWAKRVGTRHAVAVTSCSAALEIAFRYAGVDGKEVIVPTNTFVATANAAIYAGARVVFADCNDRDFCLDVDNALAKITEHTRVIVAVHVAGFVADDLRRLREECSHRGICLVEDCAHASGASLDGREVGAWGDIGCFSLYPTKVLTCGVGGVLTTDDDNLATFARSLRHHGQGESLEDIVHHGNDWLMDEVRAVLAYAQLSRLDDFLAVRRAVAKRYDSLLAEESRVTLPRLSSSSKPAYYKYPVVLDHGIDRDHVLTRLIEEHQIQAGALYSPPCHLMPVFASAGIVESMPTAETLLPRQLCLPMHAAMEMEHVDRTVAAFRSVLDDCA